MNDAKYIGPDVHQATISAAVRDSDGKLVLEAILETKAESILQFIHGLLSATSCSFICRTSVYCAFTIWKNTSSCGCFCPEIGSNGLTG
jgi:hypothetical protein